MAKTDEQLVVEALGGSQRAFRELVHRFERPVYNLIARMVHDRALAEDLAQEAFLKAFDRLATFCPEQGKFSNWIFKIAHNRAIDHLRRRSLDTVPLDASEDDEWDHASTIADPDATSPLDLALEDDVASALSTAIELLRSEYREAVVLRHQEGLSYEEIAGVMDLPLGTVKTYLFRARKELAGLLMEAGYDPFEGRSGSGGRGETRPANSA